MICLDTYLRANLFEDNIAEGRTWKSKHATKKATKFVCQSKVDEKIHGIFFHSKPPYVLKQPSWNCADCPANISTVQYSDCCSLYTSRAAGHTGVTSDHTTCWHPLTVVCACDPAVAHNATTPAASIVVEPTHGSTIIIINYEHFSLFIPLRFRATLFIMHKYKVNKLVVLWLV